MTHPQLSARQGFPGLHQPKLGFEFVAPLVADMCQDDPAKRPTMSEVVTRFDEIVQGLSTWKLRSRVVGVGDFAIASFFRDIPHWVRRLRYIASRVPAIPTLPPNGKRNCLLHVAASEAHVKSLSHKLCRNPGTDNIDILSPSSRCSYLLAVICWFALISFSMHWRRLCPIRDFEVAHRV
jgi:hypothetical protein